MARQEAIPLDTRAVAAYVHDMTVQLARFAREHGLPELACFLEMAAIEAHDRAHGLTAPASPEQSRNMPAGDSGRVPQRGIRVPGRALDARRAAP